MAIQMSSTLRNARADAIESTIGSAGVLKIWTGAQPTNCSSTDTGTELISYTLSTNWMGAASSGVVAFNDTPIAGVASSSGNAGHYRVYGPLGSTCHMQGSVGLSSNTPDMTIDVVEIVTAQTVNVVSWTISEANS
jgi:hypothetical protein